MKQQVTIEVVPRGVVLEAYQGDSLYTVLLVNNLLSEGEEAVRLEKGSVSAAEDGAREQERFSASELTDGWMLASERRLTGDAVIFIPEHQPLLEQLEEEQAQQHNDEEDAPQKGLGLVVDVGSGLIVAGLAELTKLAIPVISGFDNSQCRLLGDWGARLQYMREQENGLRQLQTLLWQDIEDLLLHLAGKTGFDPQEVKNVLIAGNTSLERVLWGEMPGSPLPEGRAWHDMRRLPAAQTPLAHLLPAAAVQGLPSIAADLGSDLVAGILASGLDQKIEHDALSLFVDMGLSTEVVAVGRGRLLAASVNTAPLEGVGLSCGMRATAGAVIDVHLADDVWLRTVRDAKPRGVCGAGLIAAAHVLLQHGLLEEEGRILAPEDPTPLVAAHFTLGLGGVEFVLSQQEGKDDIYVEQNDIRQLQMAKGSIYAACMALLAELQAAPDELEQIIITESFRKTLDARRLLDLGFVPALPPEQVKVVGNLAWQGAYLCLGNPALLGHAQRLVALTERLDLSANLVYATEFLPAMNFKEPE